MSLKKIRQTIKVLKQNPTTYNTQARRALESVMSRAEFTDPHEAIKGNKKLQNLVEKHGTTKKKRGGLIGDKLINSFYTGIK